MNYLRNYGLLNVKDRLARVEGVGQVLDVGGGEYAMRCGSIAQGRRAHLSANDVVRRDPRAERAGRRRRCRGTPTAQAIDLQLSINAQGRLANEEDFGDIIVKTDANGAVTRLRDIARIELGAADYALRSLLTNKPRWRSACSPRPAPTRCRSPDKVRKTMAEIKKAMPDGLTTTSSTTRRSSCAPRSTR